MGPVPILGNRSLSSSSRLPTKVTWAELHILFTVCQGRKPLGGIFHSFSSTQGRRLKQGGQRFTRGWHKSIVKFSIQPMSSTMFCELYYTSNIKLEYTNAHFFFYLAIMQVVAVYGLQNKKENRQAKKRSVRINLNSYVARHLVKSLLTPFQLH
jgi:hypothetical protein